MMNVLQSRFAAPQKVAFGRDGEHSARIKKEKAPKVPLKSKLSKAAGFTYKKVLTPIGHGATFAGFVAGVATVGVTVARTIAAGICTPLVNYASPIAVEKRASQADAKKIMHNADLIAKKNCLVNIPGFTCLDQSVANAVSYSKEFNPKADYLRSVGDSLKRDDSASFGFAVSKKGPTPNKTFGVDALRKQDSLAKALDAQKEAAETRIDSMKAAWSHAKDSMDVKFDLRADSLRSAAKKIRH